jgi:hypothetical protein
MVTNELLRIWKGAVLFCFKVRSQTLPKGTENHNKFVRTISLPAEITKHGAEMLGTPPQYAT